MKMFPGSFAFLFSGSSSASKGVFAGFQFPDHALEMLLSRIAFDVLNMQPGSA